SSSSPPRSPWASLRGTGRPWTRWSRSRLAHHADGPFRARRHGQARLILAPGPHLELGAALDDEALVAAREQVRADGVAAALARAQLGADGDAHAAASLRIGCGAH